jgi:hypothetical protein
MPAISASLQDNAPALPTAAPNPRPYRPPMSGRAAADLRIQAGRLRADLEGAGPEEFCEIPGLGDHDGAEAAGIRRLRVYRSVLPGQHAQPEIPGGACGAARREGGGR